MHKQAISGDAPSSLATQSAAERSKYQAWLNKSGLSRPEAMRLYLQESDRQLRVYGHERSCNNGQEQEQQQPPAAISNGNHNNTENGGSDQQQTRGLAAIPLLCAAASESRQAYLRRLANTAVEQAWWGRQEPLTAIPGSILALPEALLIGFAALIERICLTAEGFIPMVPIDVLRSFLWPMHNSLLALWMGYILVATSWTAAVELSQTVVWGSRRTGTTLEVVWKEQVIWCAQSVGTLAESHQTLTARLTGLSLWVLALLVSFANTPGSILWKSIAFVVLLCSTWWYWLVVLPWSGVALLFLSILAGNCFALIELAGV